MTSADRSMPAPPEPPAPMAPPSPGGRDQRRRRAHGDPPRARARRHLGRRGNREARQARRGAPMTDPLERVLQLVAEGKLSADDAAPILTALDRKSRPDTSAGAPRRRDMETAQAPAQNPRFARIEVRERGRRVVDLRVPISLGRFALSRVPGLSTQQIAEVEDAVTSGRPRPDPRRRGRGRRRRPDRPRVTHR